MVLILVKLVSNLYICMDMGVKTINLQEKQGKLLFAMMGQMQQS